MMYLSVKLMSVSRAGASRAKSSQFILSIYRDGHSLFGAEVFNSKVFRFFGIKIFAAENINKCPVANFITVNGDRGGFNKLHGGISFEFANAESLNKAGTMGNHVYYFNHFVNKQFYGFGIGEFFPIAVVQINRC